MGNRETTTIEVSQETWRRLTQRKDAPGTSFDDVIQSLLDADERGTGDTIKGYDSVSEDAALARNRDEASRSSPPAPDRHAIVESVADSWDDDGRHEDRRAAANAAMSLVLERGQLNKQEAIDELLPEHAVEGQSPETWWRKNIRPVIQQAATFSKAQQAYVLDEE